MPRLRSELRVPVLRRRGNRSLLSLRHGFLLVLAMSGPSTKRGGDFLLLAYAASDGRCMDVFDVPGLRKPAPDLPADIHHAAFTAGSARAVYTDAPAARSDSSSARRV